MNLSKFFPYTCFNALLFTSLLLSGCGSDGDSANLAKAVKLEEQRQKGTIIESLDILGGQTRLVKGETHQLTAIGLDSKGNIRDITTGEDLKWTSSDEAIAKVNNQGLVTAVKNSDINQGIITITATTINDIDNTTDISVNNSKPVSIVLNQVEPEAGNINTCIDAKITSDVTYEDDYISLNTTRGVDFSIDENSTAVINNDGDLYTSAAVTEQRIVTGSISDTINNTLTVIAEPSNLNELAILHNKEEVSLITLDVGDRIQVNAQATLLPEISDTVFNINNSVQWSSHKNEYIGVTNTSDTKGTLLALKPGITQLYSECGGKKATATVEVKGEAALEDIIINNGEDEILIAPNSSINLLLTASYKDTLRQENVSEFSNWSLEDSPHLKAVIINDGTDEASYKITSLGSIGLADVLVTYDGITKSVRINIGQTTN